MIVFSPNKDCNYRHDYEKIVADINQNVAKDKFGDAHDLVREWSLEDLFFYMHFLLRIDPINHPWLVQRIYEVQDDNHNTMDLWAREHWKALDCDTLILTTTGWKRHGDLEPGDQLFGSEGQVVTVIANTGEQLGGNCLEIIFDDCSIVCHEEHLWPLETKVKNRIPGTNQRIANFQTEIVEARDLPVTSEGNWKYRCPRTPIIQGNFNLLPLDPYVLGVWLGDGTASSGDITSNDPEIFEYFEAVGFEVEFKDGYRYTVHTLRKILGSLGLLNNKYIPFKYLCSSPANRLALLQGLMDTDGFVNERGTAYFYNVNHLLAVGVFHLAAGLGMKPHITRRNGDPKFNGQPYYEVTFQAYKNQPPFRLFRKVERCKNGAPKNNGRYIREICPVESRPVNCIQVDAEDGIYLAGPWLVPTHNSTIITYGLNLWDATKNPEERIGIFSHTRGIAKSFLRKIKHTCETNPNLPTFFPEVFWQNPKGDAPKWSEDDGLILKRQGVYQEATFEAWGLVDGQPTSKHFTVLNYDDVVTIESVSTPDQIAKTEDAFRISLNLGESSIGRKRLIGTNYHFADLYTTQEKAEIWKVRRHPCTKEGVYPGTPVLMSQELLHEKRKLMGPYVFACQMLLNPVADENQVFKRGWLKYYREAPKTSNMNLYLFVDPASGRKEKQSRNDYTVMWLWGLDARKNYWLLDMVRDKLNLTQRWKELKRLMTKWPRCQKVYYESYGLQADKEHFESKMGDEGVYFTIDELGGKLAKTDRIGKLVPLFEDGRVLLPEVLFTQDGTRNLIKEFVDQEYLLFPFAPHDDMLDAASRVEDEKAEVWFPTSYPDDEDEQPQKRVIQLNNWSGRKAKSRYARV